MRLRLLLPLFLISRFISAQIPNWSEHIAPVIYRECSGCHNSSGIAPFELMSYYDALSNASDIRSEVITRSMPPWPPDPNYSRFAHERVLTDQEISDIVSWIDNGMPLGDTALEPDPPVITGVATLQNPDLVLQMPTYTVNTTTDLYRCFVIPTGMTSDQYILELEAVPGNRNIVHHILIYEDASSVPLTLDANDPDPGYTNFGGTGSPNSKLIGVWVPGQQNAKTPAGMGINLPANTNIILQIHYPGGITNEVDSTQLLLKLSSSFQREVYIVPPLHHYDLNEGPLIIPANTVKTFTADYTVPADISALSVGPHMHLIGKSISCFGVTPSQDTIPFINIPDWHFHWQGMYSFPRIIKVPNGTTLYSSATYDNTSANHHNPNFPPQLVTLGESTTDEMMLIYFAYAIYQPGDENIVIDSAVVAGIYPVDGGLVNTAQLYDPFPNPGTETVNIQFYVPGGEDYILSVTDNSGKSVKKIYESSAGTSIVGHQAIDVSDLPGGIYFVSLQSGKVTRTKKLVVR